MEEFRPKCFAIIMLPGPSCYGESQGPQELIVLADSELKLAEKVDSYKDKISVKCYYGNFIPLDQLGK